MHHYCTLFDFNYLPNFLALNESIKTYSINEKPYKIFAFCMDERSLEYINSNIDNGETSVEAVSLSQLYSKYPHLKEINNQRSLVEFYFTCSPHICSYVLETSTEIPSITYLDADLLFFNSLELIHQEIGIASISIIEHKFYGWGKKYLKYGKYNVGWVTFKNDNEGKDCLNGWLNDCKTWCYDYYDEENKRFGDQKYLDNWEQKYRNLKILYQKGANVAPWNAGQYNFKMNKNKQILIDEDPLVFFHFASFKRIDKNRFTTNMSRYFSRPCKIIKNDLYGFYLLRIIYYQNVIDRYFEIKKSDFLMRRRDLVINRFSIRNLSAVFSSVTRFLYNDYVRINMPNNFTKKYTVDTK